MKISKLKLVFGLFSILSLLIFPFQLLPADAASAPATKWAVTTTAAEATTMDWDVTTDASGNVYAVGSIGLGANSFGNGITATGTADSNVLIVKYNSSGVAQWAKSVVSGEFDSSVYYNVSVDTTGNVYAVGYIAGLGTYDFGGGITVSGAGVSGYDDVIIVKYNSSGVTQWANSASVNAASTGSASYMGVTVDSAGNVYAVGNIASEEYGFGGGITAESVNDYGLVSVKYSSLGVAQWAKVVEGSSEACNGFHGVATDTTGNIYIAGVLGTGLYSFGGGVTATGVASCNSLVAKYNPAGTAQWAKTTLAGSMPTQSYDISTDASGNSYAAGGLWSTGNYNFGDGVSLTSTSGAGPFIVKYNSDGDTQWAQTTLAGIEADDASFYDISTDISGNSYAIGYIAPGTYTFGDGVSLTGVASTNAAIVSYDSSGNAQWAKTTLAGSGYSNYHGVSVDDFGNIYAFGDISSGASNFGDGISATGAFGWDVALVKYSDSVTPDPDPIPNPNSGTVNSTSISGITTLPATGSGR